MSTGVLWYLRMLSRAVAIGLCCVEDVHDDQDILLSEATGLWIPRLEVICSKFQVVAKTLNSSVVN